MKNPNRQPEKISSLKTLCTNFHAKSSQNSKNAVKIRKLKSRETTLYNT
ncbi:hypothetical protein GCWU000324_02523 [Kingella oralis ATCC 51147]|uniref:Uncharacterized protein n=1 Tax=Kingella oralis ATCC 51147 TaxID=629741 RepID=C4GLF2_9NEIS|nr:hypothetical protein GCWU000324_02523 [Kingella oralis ATCC 51147]